MDRYPALALVLIVAFGLSTAAARANDDPPLKELVERVDAHYERVGAFSARFVQRFERRLMRRTMVESGTVDFKKPGKMRWAYESPEEKLFVTDGAKTYFYIPAERQVMVSQEQSGDGILNMAQGSPFELLAGKARLTDTFEYFRAPSEPRFGGQMIQLVPFKRQGSFEEIELEVNPSNGQVQRVILVDAQSNRTEFSFEAIEENVEIEDSRFRFAIPAGVEVVVAPANARQ